MPDNHLGDRAELYALGALDSAEAELVNAHAATCADCATLVGNAERTIAMLDAMTVPTVTPPAELGRRIAESSRFGAQRRVAPPVAGIRYAALAAAIALLIGGVAGSRSVLHMREVVAQDDVALAVVANSHFKHASLSKIDANAPTSKVLWGLSNRWVYVIVDSANCACRVVATTDGGERDLGVPLARGRAAALFANDLPPVRRIELRRDGRVLENVTLPR